LVSMTRSSPAAPRKRQTSTAALRGRNGSPAPGAGATALEGSYGEGAGQWSLRRRMSASMSTPGPSSPSMATGAPGSEEVGACCWWELRRRSWRDWRFGQRSSSTARVRRPLTVGPLLLLGALCQVDHRSTRQHRSETCLSRRFNLTFKR
jgi:hypothetical protein